MDHTFAYCGDLKSNHLKSVLFEGRISNGSYVDPHCIRNSQYKAELICKILKNVVEKLSDINS